MKLIIVAIVFGMTTKSYAQIFGVKAGLNLSKMMIKGGNEIYSDNNGMKSGFHIGGTVEFPISEVFSLESGLQLSTKGFKSNGSILSVEYNEKWNLYYLDIPLTGKAFFDVTDDIKMFGIFGPYLGIGLSGKTEVTVLSKTENRDVKWGSGEDKDFKRLDSGLIFGAGVEFNSIQVELAYNLGLANIVAYRTGNSEAKNRVLEISIAYKFFGK